MKTRPKQLSDEANKRTVELVRKLREERRMTQVELAQALRMTQPGLSNLLNGRQRASLAIAQHAASLAKVPLAELLADANDGAPSALLLSESRSSGGAKAASRQAFQLSDEANARTLALLCKLRDESGLTQAELAEAIGSDQPTVSLLLAGQKRASYRFAKGVADFAGVSIVDLLGSDFAPRRADAFVSYAPTRPIDAVRSMGDAEGYDRAWVAQWVPIGGLDVPYTADELWRLMKADYAKLGARQPRDAYDANEAIVMIGKLKELFEQFQPPAPSSTPPAASVHVAAQAKLTRRKR